VVETGFKPVGLTQSTVFTIDSNMVHALNTTRESFLFWGKRNALKSLRQWV
jgi:hypothetical protein